MGDYTIDELATLDTLAADCARAVHDFCAADGLDRVAPALRVAWCVVRAYVVGEPPDAFMDRVSARFRWQPVAAWTWDVGATYE